jgi:hypothetical protein
MNIRTALLAVGWLAGAAGAATGVTLALNVMGSGLFGTTGHPLSEAQVAQQLAQAGPEPSAATAGPGTAGPATPAGQSTASGVKNTTGGTVIVWCTGRQATQTASPAQGYSADDVSPGPAPVTSVTFRSGSSEIHVTGSCATGQAKFAVSTEQRHGGGGDDNDGTTPAVPASPGSTPATSGDDHGGAGGGKGNGGGGGSGGGSGGGGGGGGDNGGGGGGGSGGGGGHDG